MAPDSNTCSRLFYRLRNRAMAWLLPYNKTHRKGEPRPVVRSTTPLFTTIIYRAVYGRTFSTATYLSLLPIVLGVSLATYGDMTYTSMGFALTFLGVILAALKTIVTNRMMTGRLALGFWEILLRMSPLACLQSLVFAAAQGELNGSIHSLRNALNTTPSLSLAAGSTPSSPSTTTANLPDRNLALILLGNGILAFILNVSSFSTNKVAGALTMTVCANVKQCLTIVLGIMLFHATVTATNLGGILVTLAGGAAYSFAELKGKKGG
ncbi:MAG: hypothetical protein Q9227_003668 [Pyrenula ochraceoflavens]